VIATTAPDLLIVVAAILATGVAASHLMFRKSPLARAITRVVFLVLLTVAMLLAGIVPYQPLKPTGTPFHDAALAVLKIVWWLWMAWFLIGFLRAFVIIEHRPREGKLLQDLLAGLIYVAALFAIIAYVFELPVQSLLATSGVIAIILGLALQSTLSDVFSGMVLSVSRPYRPGDWISVEGGTDGRVIEMNWRATHVLTARRDLAILPNSTIAKSKIVNVSSPSGIHGSAVTLQIGSTTSPSLATEILERAILNCRMIIAEPAPIILIKSINGASFEFEITFFVETLSALRNAQNELLDLAYRHLTAAGVGLAVVDQAAMGQNSAKERTQAETVLDWVEIFSTLTTTERTLIAASLKPRSFDRHERLLEPGALPQSLFIVGSGVLSLTRHDLGDGREVLRLGPGDHYGEIGLVTGTPSAATITALTPVTLYELAKDGLARVLETRPEVAHELGCAMARRQAAGLTTADNAELEHNVPAHRLTSWFTARIQRLYDVDSAA
jgi:small-conductance mechanosensitive channel